MQNERATTLIKDKSGFANSQKIRKNNTPSKRKKEPNVSKSRTQNLS
jgi:hypothetical protein